MDLEIELKKLASANAFFYVALDPERALGVEDILPNYAIICPYKSWLTEELKAKGISVFILEEEAGLMEAEKIAEKGSYGILQSGIVREYIQFRCAGSNPAHMNVRGWTPHIVVLKTSFLIEDFCKKQGWNLLAPKADLAEKYENKISQFNALKCIVPYPKSYTTTAREVYEKEISYPFVLQFNRGHSGNSTFFINSRADLEDVYKLYPKREVKISELIKGTPYTLNCLVLKNGKALTGSLSAQITGLDAATNSPNTTVGNDWVLPRKLDSKTADEIQSIAEKIGRELSGENYRGFFGIDVMAEESSGKIYFIELNTHQPASVSFEARIHRAMGKSPLLAYFLMDSGVAEVNAAVKDLPPFILPIRARQIIYRNKTERVINREEILEKYADKHFASRMTRIKPNEEIWREQMLEGI